MSYSKIPIGVTVRVQSSGYMWPCVRRVTDVFSVPSHTAGIPDPVFLSWFVSVCVSPPILSPPQLWREMAALPESVWFCERSSLATHSPEYPQDGGLIQKFNKIYWFPLLGSFYELALWTQLPWILQNWIIFNLFSYWSTFVNCF